MTNSVAALGALELAEEQAAADYTALARCFRGWAAAALERLARESRGRSACVRGIRILIDGEGTALRVPAPASGPVDARLRGAYCRAMRTLVAYEARSREGEYGCVFSGLAAQQQAHCRTLLEIIGSAGG